MRKGLRISEHFYSLQGEGQTMGIPSVFLRLTACNLLCDHEWTCDTIEVWKTGDTYTNTTMLEIFEENEYQDKLFKGAHLVITGGEPLLQQEEIVSFLEDYYNKFFYLPYIEIETNATKMPLEKLNKYVSLFNVSPKLSNAGMSEKRRLVPDVIEKFNLMENSIFKFVIANKEDWRELKEKILTPFDIRNEKLWLMPAADTIDMLKTNGVYVAEICKKNTINYSSRLQLELWEQTTGV